MHELRIITFVVFSFALLQDAAALSTSLLLSSTVAPKLSNTSSSMVQVATMVTTTVHSSFSSSIFIAASTQIANASDLVVTAGKNDGGQNEDTGECKLLGPFALIVQAALGLLALSSLVFKRWRERPQRPVKIWAFDASKQVFGTALLHLANLFMSMFSAGQIQATLAKAAASTIGANGEHGQPNPCSFYLLNLAIDTTIGIPILIVLLRLVTACARLTPLANPPESIQSGNYGQPPKTIWWLKQSILYFLGLLLMKVCVFFIFQLCPWIIVVGNWALRWTEGNEALQIAFVMLIFPLIMNALQYYIIDSFIKNNKSAPPEVDEVGEHGGGEEEGLLPEEEDTDNGIVPDETRKEVARVTTKAKGLKTKSYGANQDSQPGTPVGESSSSTSHLEENEATTKPA